MTRREEQAMQNNMAGDRLLDVAVIGGSQAGLAMAWHLTRQNLRFVVLEAGPEIGHTWRSRWDSLTLFTPTQYDALPGMPFPGKADTYPAKDPVAGYLQAYADTFHLHGAGRFLVLARDAAPEPNLVWKDTVLVRTGQTVDILFDVTNPGLWMAHCHIAEHMQSGMMFSFTVARSQGAGR